MLERRVRGYVEIVLAAAKDVETLESLRLELDRFRQAVEAVPMILRVANNPALPREARQRACDRVARELDCSELSRRLIRMLVTHYRLGEIRRVVERIEETVRQRQGIARAEIKVPHALGEKEKKRLAETLGKLIGQKVELDIQVNPELLGGFVAQVESRLYDASVQGQLKRMADRLAQA